MKYLLLYLEETYGLTNEKKIDNAIGIVANENKYHPIRDYLNTLVWDGTERIRFCLRHFLGADADDYTYEALKLFLLTVMRYSENNLSAGVAYQGDYKTVVLGFPFESIRTDSEREAFMNAVLTFFNDNK